MISYAGLREYVESRYNKKYNDFTKYFDEYSKIKNFAPDGNLWESGQEISEQAHYIMRLSVQFFFSKAFMAMKMDLDNPNVKEILEEGNIGTSGRLAKVYCGDGLHDSTEMGSGRWSIPPRIASFPNEQTAPLPITKRVDLVSNCSHHTLPFSTMFRPDSYAIVSYIPKDKVLGISKLQRVIDHISRRYWLQEDLTLKIYEAIKESAKTEDVLVRLVNVVHTCEKLRGTQSQDGAFTSEMYGGKFKDPELRKEVR